MRRALIWLVTLPFAAASVLLGHAVAYRVVGSPADTFHGYLAHAPQVVLVLATIAVVGLAVDTRARSASPKLAVGAGVVAFAVQEHLERFLHTGHIPFLLTSPVLWLGVALQLPLAIAVWVAARRLAGAMVVPVRRSVPRLGSLSLALPDVIGRPLGQTRTVARAGRGPPILL